MVVIWSKEIDSRGTVKGVIDNYDNVLKSCVECEKYKEIEEFNKNPNIKSHLLFEVLEDECLDCMVNKKEFPLLPENNQSNKKLIKAYHDFKKLYIKDKKRNDYEIWEFKVEPKSYILYIKDKQKDILFSRTFTNMQGKDSTRHAAYRYFIKEYDSEFFSNIKTMTICSYSIERSRSLVRRNYRVTEFLTFIPEIYHVDLHSIEKDLEAMDIENAPEKYQSILEGKVMQFYGNKYERSPVNRQKALELHGFSCTVCGFNFERVYGERGKGFIEVHHVKPLHSFNGKEHYFDPRTDLIPVCSNCHRMIHRRPDNILTIEEVRSIIIIDEQNK
jgi:predicted HNH restriction endonuclease